MVSTRDTAPSFTAPFVSEQVEEKSFDGEGLTVLAFFPGAFTGVCTDEMCELRDQMSEFEELGAEVLGVSVDTPFSLKEFRSQNDLGFELVSDSHREIVDAYDVKMDFEDIGFRGLAKRSVFLVKDGEVVYSEVVLDDPEQLPDMDALKQEIESINS